MRRQDSMKFESLEDRALMAGDVAVQIAQGFLVIEGDKADNQIMISRSADGALSVAAIGDTTINGGADPFQTSRNVRGINVRLGDGSDDLAVQNLRLNGSLNINLGDGSDHLSITQSAIRGDIRVDGGGGNDSVQVGSNPLVTPTAASALNGDVQANGISINLGNGENTLAVTSTDIRRDLSIAAGNGADRISLGAFPGPAARVSSSALTSDSSVRVGQLLNLLTGDGNDVVRVNSVSARAAIVLTGDGDDKVIASNTHFDAVFAYLGSGDDLLDGSGGNNDIGWLLALGGSGIDTLVNSSTNKIGHAVTHGFE